MKTSGTNQASALVLRARGFAAERCGGEGQTHRATRAQNRVARRVCVVSGKIEVVRRVVCGGDVLVSRHTSTVFCGGAQRGGTPTDGHPQDLRSRLSTRAREQQTTSEIAEIIQKFSVLAI